MPSKKIVQEQESDEDKLKKLAAMLSENRVDPGCNPGIDPRNWKKLVNGWHAQGLLLLRIAALSARPKGKSRSQA